MLSTRSALVLFFSWVVLRNCIEDELQALCVTACLFAAHFAFAPQAEEERAPDEPLLAVGQVVVVGGLEGAKEHNGKFATVRAYKKGKDRFVVELSTGELVALKAANLTAA